MTVNYTLETQHDIGKPPFPIGTTSSNGGCSSVMFVFGGVISQILGTFGIKNTPDAIHLSSDQKPR